MVGWFSQLPRTESAALLIVGLVLLAFMVGAWLSWLEERAADRSKTVRPFTHVKAEEGEFRSPI
jgi:hypothetical protein